MPQDEYTNLKELEITDSQIFAFQALDLSTYYMIRWTKLGLKPDDVRILSLLSVAPREYEAFAKHGFTVNDIKAIKEYDLEPKDYVRMQKQGVPPDQMKAALEHEDEIKQYKKFKLNLCEMKKLFDLNVSADEYDELRKSGLKYDDIVYMKENNVPFGDYVQMKRQGLANSDIDKIREYNLDPNEYIAGKRKGFAAEKILEILKTGWTTDEFVKLKNMSLSIDDTKRIKSLNMSIEEFEKLTKIGVDLEILSEIIKNGIEVDEYLDWKNQGFNIEDMIELKSESVAKNKDTENVKIEIKKPEEIKIEKEEAEILNVQILSNAEGENCVNVQNTIDSLEQRVQKGPAPNIPNAIENINLDERIPNSSIQRKSIASTESIKFSSKLEEQHQQTTKKNLAVVASSSGTPASILKLLTTSFQMVDRVLIKTNWGDFVAFMHSNVFALYEGCACNLDNIRSLNLSEKHSFLLYFDKLESLIVKILKNKKRQCVVPKKSVDKVQLETKPKDDLTNSPNEYSDVKVQYALNVIGNKIEKLSREASTILNQFRAIQS